MSGQIETQTLIEQLAHYLARPVPAEARDRARLHLLDWVGCAVAGANEPAGKTALNRSDTSPSARAFAWGALGNILEMDDVDKRATLHPGPSIIPAALALAISIDADIDSLLTAIVRGYEATIRLGRATGPGHYALWHTTGTCGPIGAAAACASLLDLEPTASAHALSLAVSQSTGLWQTRHEPASMGKQLHTAHAARAGLDAASLASDGFHGPLSILEGQQGFFAATCPGANPEDILSNLVADWLIHDVSFKPWPACRHAHAAIDAARLLVSGGVQTNDIQSIRIETYPDALVFCDKPAPNTGIEAKFSLQHSVAVTLLHNTPELEHFTIEAIQNVDAKHLRTITTVHEDAAFTANYPARFGARVRVARKDGTTQTAEAPDALGDPENPLSKNALADKARKLITHGGQSAASADKLMDACLNTDKALYAAITEALS